MFIEGIKNDQWHEIRLLPGLHSISRVTAERYEKKLTRSFFVLWRLGTTGYMTPQHISGFFFHRNTKNCTSLLKLKFLFYGSLTL